jgi:hypothetical protein
MTNQSQPGTDSSSRKKFILWGATLLGSLGILKYINRTPALPEEKRNTVKMLTQDGKLVEVDVADLANCGRNKKVTDDELKNWVTKK